MKTMFEQLLFANECIGSRHSSF